jgi:hypothetical protein
MAKKANQQVSADDILKQMYPDIKTSEDYEDEQKAKQTTTGDDTSKTIAALQAQIARLEGSVSASQRPAPVTQNYAAPQRPVIDWDKAPDPIQEPGKYGRFLAEANQAIIDYEKQAWQYQSSQQNLNTARTQNLWAKFEANYKEYTENTDRVEIAASRVLQRLQGAGMDTDAYMYGQSDQFMKDVVAEIDTLWGKGGSGGEDDAEDDDDNRTVVLGGAGGNAKGPSQQQEQPQKYGSLSNDVLAWQEKTGFYR